MIMTTVTLDRDKIYEGNLILVNEKNHIRKAADIQLVPADEKRHDILLEAKAAEALKILLNEISAGESIVCVSGYRSLAEQTEIYEDSLRENGDVFTRKFVALPGRSEHQSGLAIDLGLNADSVDFICPDFPHSGICQRFREKAAKFGFIQRYEKGKEKITGISCEPWHFRYTGLPHSEVIKQRELALEEYIDFIKNCSSEYPLEFQNTCIYYVPASEGLTEINLPEDKAYQISGNNKDGFIVTVRR